MILFLKNAKDLTKMNLRFTLFASALLLLSACSKFENGPNVSFRTPEERIMGEWLATSNLIEDFEIQELRFEFLEEQFTITQIDMDGDVDTDDEEWRISGNNLEIVDGNDVVGIPIVWLSNKRMTLLFTDDFASTEMEVEFEKQ